LREWSCRVVILARFRSRSRQQNAITCSKIYLRFRFLPPPSLFSSLSKHQSSHDHVYPCSCCDSPSSEVRGRYLKEECTESFAISVRPNLPTLPFPPIEKFGGASRTMATCTCALSTFPSIKRCAGRCSLRHEEGRSLE
jgi:hypothetical protein